jgi:hypothetical protein
MNQEFYEAFKMHEHIFLTLQDVLKQSHHGNIGSYLMHPESFSYLIDNLDKQAALFARAKECSVALEIGSYACHSAFIMLISNPTIKVECVDLCLFPHTEKCVSVLSAVFNGRITLNKGRSPNQLRFSCARDADLIHIDGEHTSPSVNNDFDMVYEMAKPNAIIVFDDYDFNDVRNCVETAVSSNRIRSVELYGRNSMSAIGILSK